MNKATSFSPRFDAALHALRRASLLASLLVVATGSAHAANRTWVASPTTSDWATPANWGGTAPASGDALIFSTSGSTTLTNTLTSTAFNVAGITFSNTAPAYTMNGNTFNLTTGITNNSGVLQTFNNTGISGTTVTPTSTAGLTTSAGLTFNTGTGGLTLSGLQFTMGGTSGVTTTVNGTGTMTIGVLGLDIGSGNRIVQTFAGSAPIVVTTINTGGTGSASNNSFGYAGTGTFTLNGVANPTSFADFVSSGVFNLNGTISAGMNASGTGVFNESATGVLNGGSNGSFTQSSTGTSTLAGANTYTGATTVNAGALVLDHSVSGAPATNIINNASNGSALTLGGGTLSIKGNSGATNSDRFNGTTLTTLTSSKVVFTQNGAASLGATFGGLTRNAQSTLDVSLPTGAGTVSSTTTTSTGTNKINGNGVAYATANGGTTWLVNNAGALSALGAGAYQTDSFASAGGDTDITANDAPSAFTVNTLRFNTASKTLTLGSGTSTVTTGGILVTSAGTGSVITGSGAAALTTGATGKEFVIHDYADLTINAPLADAGAATLLTIAGTGVTTLGAANTFSGQTTVLGGTLKLANQLALQNSTFQYNNGTTLIFDSAGGTAFTLGGLNTNNNIALVNSASAPINLTVGGNNSSTTLGGVLSGAGGSLTKNGTGQLTLSAAETYTGATIVNGGKLYLNNAATLKFSSSVTVNGTGLLGINQGSESGEFAAGVVIQGTGGVSDEINNANTTITLDRANTYTGQTTWASRGIISAGVASTYDGSGNQTSGAFGVNSNINFNGQQATLNLAGRNNQVGSLTGGGFGVQLRGATITIGGDGTSTTTSAPIGNNYLPGSDSNGTGVGGQAPGGNVIKIGGGTQTFSSTTNLNSYEGTTTIKGGVLSTPVLGTSGFVAPATSTFNGTNIVTVSSTAGLVVGMNIFEVRATGGGTTITAIDSVNNKITLSGSVGFSGTQNIVPYGFGSGIGISGPAASNLVLDGGTLQYTGTATTTDRLFTVGSTVAGATGTLDASGTGALTFSNTGAIAYGTTGQTRTLGLTGSNTGANSLAASIGDNGAGAVSVTKTGSGNWSLTGANSYSGGTTVSSGTLTSAVAGGFGAGDVTVAPTGTLTADSATLNSTGSIASTALVTVNNNSAAIGTINFNGATPTIGGLSGSGKAVLNNAAGTALTVGSTNNLSSTFSGVISEGTPGAGSIVKAGTGTLTLSGANTYTGATQVNAGTLAVTGSLASGSTVTVGGSTGSGTPTLTGTGIVNGNVQLASAGGGVAGTINPGAVGTVGTLTVGSITFQTGSNFSLDLSGGTTDKLVINGLATIQSGADISFNATGLTGTSYILATASGGLTSSTPFTVLGSVPSGYQLVYTGTAVELDQLPTATTGQYTLTTTTGTTTLHESTAATSSTTALHTILANTGTGTQDSLNYSGLTATASAGTIGAATGTTTGTNLARGTNTSPGATQTFTAPLTSGTVTISNTGTVTNSVLGGPASGTNSTTTISVYSGQSHWASATSGSWGTLGGAGSETFGQNWAATDGSPGLDPSFTGVDTANFGTVAGTGSTTTVSLNAAAPNLNAINFDSTATSYTIQQGSGSNSITLSGTTPSITVTSGNHAITAPIILGANTTVTDNGTLALSGPISGAHSLTNAGSGTTTLTGTNSYSSTTVNSGSLYANSVGAVGTGSVTVNGGTFGGSATVHSTVTLASGATIRSGIIETGTVVTSKMTLDNTSLHGTIFDASAGGVTLAFNLGAGNAGLNHTTPNATPLDFSNPNISSSYLTVLDDGLADSVGELKFSTGVHDIISLTDISGGALQLTLSTPYLLIKASSNAAYSGLVTTGGIDGNGYALNGYVTNLDLNTVGNHTQYLYLYNGNLEVVPEPGTWALMISGLAVLVFIQRRRSKRS